MRPPHRDFRHPQSMALRQKQNLRVKPETLDSLLLKNNFCALSAEGIEPALRVGKTDPHDPAHHAVEEYARLLANYRLVDFDEGPIQGPGPHGGLTALGP